MTQTQLVSASAVSAASGQGIAIVGDGARALSVAALMHMAGRSARLLTAGAALPADCELRERGASVGWRRASLASLPVEREAGPAIQGCPVIIIAASAGQYRGIVARLANCLKSGQTVVLADAPLLGAVQFACELRQVNPLVKPNILETGSFFDRARCLDSVLLIEGLRTKISVCGLTRNETFRGMTALGNIAAGLVPASNILERGLGDIERLIRPIVSLVKLAMPADGAASRRSLAVTPFLTGVVEAVWAEIEEVARAFSVRFSALPEQLADFTGEPSEQSRPELASFLLQLDSCLGDLEEPALLESSVGDTLVPFSCLALAARVPVPKTDALIELSSAVCRKDLRREGRTLAELGLIGYQLEELIEIVHA